MKIIKSKLRILAVNVRGIECNGRLEQIRILLTKHLASVAVLSETETSHSTAETTNIEGFKAFCPPNSVIGPTGKEVGVILMISNKLAVSAKPRPDINGDDTIQTIWIEIGNHDLIIGGIYRRARSSADLEKEEFAQLSNQILKAASTGKKVLLLGDTNIDHNNPKHKKANEAEALLSDIEAANMRRLPSSIPTWKSYGRHKVCQCPTSSKKANLIPLNSEKGRTACGCPKDHLTSTIDNAYLSLSESASLQVLDDALSDHYPILVNLDIKVGSNKTKTKTIYRRDIARLKVSDLENALETKDFSPLYSITDPNEAVALLIKLVKEALDIVAPLKAIKFRPDKQKISLKRDTLATMTSRDKARRSGDKERFKTLRNAATKLIKRDKIQGVITRLQKNPGPKQVWQEAKSFLGRGRGTTLPECTTNTDPNDTAEHQNKFFVSKIARLVSSFTAETEVPKSKPKATPKKKSFSFTFVTAGSVTRIIKSLKDTKAMGVDEIPTQVWKKGVVVLAGPIAHVCNISLSSGIFPDLFKEAIVHPVFKGSGKDPRDPGSYRPISILPSLSKILETAVRDALLEWLMLQGFIPDSQFGYLPGRSNTMALACAQNDWFEAKSTGEAVGVLAFDFSAAFDCIAYTTLLNKLESANITGIPLKWIKSYVSGRSQKVLWNDVLSGPQHLTHGVPQGSILGPLLFLVMVADMHKSVIGDSPNANLMAYADDSTLYVHSKNMDLLRKDLETLSARMISYCHGAGLVLNNDKTQLLVSSSKKFQIKVGSSLISNSPVLKLLGVEFDSNFSTTPSLKTLATAAKTRASMIYRLSFSIPPHLLTTLANGLLMGKVLAAAPINIPTRLNSDDYYHGYVGVTEDINKAIKATARTITKSKLSDKICSEVLLQKAGLKCLNEAVASMTAVSVWKSKTVMDPLGQRIFNQKPRLQCTRSGTSKEICLPVPGYPTLSTNIMARIWNAVPGLQHASTLGAAKSLAKKWARDIPR